MNCQNHPDREATSNCSVCGKPICNECTLKIGGKSYCQDCATQLISAGQSQISADPKTNTENNKDNTEGPKKDKKENNVNKDNENYINMKEVIEAKKQEELNKSDPEVEAKYERYLEDLHHDEEEPIQPKKEERKELSLSEQLAKYEEENGLIIPEKPKKEEPEMETFVQEGITITRAKDNSYHRPNEEYHVSRQEYKHPIKEQREFSDQDSNNYKPVSLHQIHYKKEKEEENKVSLMDYVLIAILAILIMVVTFYILNIIFNQGSDPTEAIALIRTLI
ncbi:B-box zinc finger protein [Methanobrevibacter filiformis]|uniref:B box-type domain-containing protein n=1 Tax=Methanobrevibacter filiformis TaxID=55758 RepID=A0A166ESJ5_9EURY|nr:B-box zinc finger protein [Methanobrevibacter filiformis]KZX16962.1 hypothetical protein MBFIL_04350 [Methanobrevibacter filiformis]